MNSEESSQIDLIKSRFEEINREVKESCLLAGFDEKQIVLIQLIVWEAIGIYKSYRE